MAVTKKTLWDSVKELVLEQYKSSSNFRAMIQSVVEECAQTVEDQVFELQDFFDLEKANGEWLDILGRYVSLERQPDEPDDEYRTRISIECITNDAGTPDNVIRSAKIISGDPRPRYFDEAPATFFIYTPNGRQLKRAQVKKLAPTGVLGLPGAAIRLGNGKHWRGVDGKKILCVAQDTRRYVTAFVVDEQGRFAVNESGVRVVAVLE